MINDTHIEHEEEPLDSKNETQEPNLVKKKTTI